MQCYSNWCLIDMEIASILLGIEEEFFKKNARMPLAKFMKISEGQHKLLFGCGSQCEEFQAKEKKNKNPPIIQALMEC